MTRGVPRPRTWPANPRENGKMEQAIPIRELLESDCPIITQAFSDQGWNKPLSQYLRYYRESQAGTRSVLLAHAQAEFAGYITILWEADYPPFREAGLPMLVDLNVLIKFRREGIGTALLEAAEHAVAERSPLVGLGVGVHHDYGPAQVLYAQRGYLPDGRGLHQAGRYPGYGEQVQVDDDLCLYLTRRLR
jgi:GNAT superfamily N-acetyltransferase